MIDYDSFLHCHLTDISFRHFRGSERVKEKGDVMSCGSYCGVKLQLHAMKIVERVLGRSIRTLVNLNKMKFGYMPGKGQWMQYSL